MPTEEKGGGSEETIFLKAFGIKSPALRILDFLMDNKAFDYSKTDIAKGAGISRTTLFSVWENLENPELVIETREVGRAKMYKLNLKNPVVKKVIELDNAICDFYASQLEKQESVPMNNSPYIHRKVHRKGEAEVDGSLRRETI